MLKIYFGDMEDAIFNTDMFFDNTYEDSWLTDPFAVRVIETIDRSEVLGPNAIKSPYLGIISPEKLAGGTKSILLMTNCPDMVFNASTCGDNCAPFILELGQARDLTINLRHLMNFGKKPFEICILNDQAVVHNMLEMMEHAFQYV